MNTDELIADVQVLLIASVIALLGIFFWFLIRRLKSDPGVKEAEEDLRTLKQLQKKESLSPEEARRVREAMARQYVKLQEERKAKLPEGKKGLEALALEAQRANVQLSKKSPRRLTRPETPAMPAQTPATPSIPPPEQPVPEKTPLPDHLRELSGRPLQDLEDLVNAGFITREDMQTLLDWRGEAR